MTILAMSCIHQLLYLNWNLCFTLTLHFSVLSPTDVHHLFLLYYGKKVNSKSLLKNFILQGHVILHEVFQVRHSHTLYFMIFISLIEANCDIWGWDLTNSMFQCPNLTKNVQVKLSLDLTISRTQRKLKREVQWIIWCHIWIFSLCLRH